MMYKGDSDEANAGWGKTGVLIANLGSPDAATPSALRRYLKEFLWDPRVVELPRWSWWLILNGFILRTRPAKSAAAYQQVWNENGAPLIDISLRQQAALKKRFAGDDSVVFALGMRYGNPSIASALEELRQARVGRIIVLPMYPQYAAATVATVMDAVFAELKTWRRVPALQAINRYCEHPLYIKALANSVREHWQRHDGPGDKLLFSFHGVPQRYVEQGDPYRQDCEKTVELLVKELELAPQQWQLTFQSRFGKEPYLQPYTDETVTALAKSGTRSLNVMCPGFSADCLETIEEINGENREYFEENGGDQFHYIPALNDREDHIDCLESLIRQQLR